MTNERAPGDGYLVLWAGSTEVNERDAQVELRRAGVRVEIAEVDALEQQVNARAPDLVVLGGTLGEEPEAVVAALTARSPGAAVPILALAPPSAASPRPRARYGLVARFDRELPPSTLASHIEKLLGALSSRSPTWRVSVRGNDLGPLAARLARSGRAGILTVESAAIVVQADGPIAPRTHEVEPGYAQFHERPADRIRVLDAVGAADAPMPTLDGVRVLVIDDDVDRRDAVTRHLEEAGAQVRATALVAQAVHASRVLDPAVVVVVEHALRSGAVLPLWSEPRLTAASVLVLDPRLAETERDALVQEVASLAGPVAKLAARLREKEAFAERLETLGPARWLKVLGRCEHEVTLRVFGAEGRARVDLTGGRIRGASFRQRAGGDVVDGRAAVDALMAMPFGRVLVGPPEALAALEGVSARRKPSVVGPIVATPSPGKRGAEPSAAGPSTLGGIAPKKPLAPKPLAPKPLAPKPLAPKAIASKPLAPKAIVPKPSQAASLASNVGASKSFASTAKVPKPSTDASKRAVPDASQPGGPDTAQRPAFPAVKRATEELAPREAPSSKLAARATAETLDEIAAPAALSVPLIDLADGHDVETGVYSPEAMEALRAATEREPSTPDIEIEVPLPAAPREASDAFPVVEAPNVTPASPAVLEAGHEKRTSVGLWFAAGILVALGAGGWVVWQLQTETPAPQTEVAVRSPSAFETPTLAEAIRTESAPADDELGEHEPTEQEARGGVDAEKNAAEASAAETDAAESTATEPIAAEPSATESIAAEPNAAEPNATEAAQPVDDAPANEAPPVGPDEGVNVFALLEEARAAGRAGDYALSERLSRQALEASPKNPRAGYRLAVSLFRLSRYEEAIEQAEQTIRWDPEDPLPVALIGDIHVHRGRFARGARFYRRALEVDPNFAPAQRALERLRARGIE